MPSELQEVLDILHIVQEDVAVLKSHVMGNGGDGLTERTVKLEREVSEWRGVVSMIRWGLPIALTLSMLALSIAARVL